MFIVFIKFHKKIIFSLFLFVSFIYLSSTQPVLAYIDTDRVNCECKNSSGQVFFSQKNITKLECDNHVGVLTSDVCVALSEGYCWCKAGVQSCSVYTNFDNGQLVKSQSDCNARCGADGMFTYEPYSNLKASTDYNAKYIYEGGCKPTYCWCQKLDGTCEKYVDSATKDSATCRSYCENDKSQKYLTFDHTYIERATEQQCNNKVKACWCKLDEQRCVLLDDALISDENKCTAECGGKGLSFLDFKAENKACKVDLTDEQLRDAVKAYVKKEEDAKAKTEPNAKDEAKIDIVVSLKDETAKLNQFSKFTGASATKTVQNIIGQAIKFLMGLMGTIVLVLYIYAGVLWMTAAGNSDSIGSAKQIMIWSTLGVIIMLSAYIIVNFVFTSLGV